MMKYVNDLAECLVPNTETSASITQCSSLQDCSGAMHVPTSENRE